METETQELSPSECLASDRFADSDHPAIQAYAKAAMGDAETDIEKAVRLYYKVRDGFRYNPYYVQLKAEAFVASNFLERDKGHCIDKANLLVACARAVGIPARLRFAKVRNHLGTAKLEEMLRSDVLVFHGMAELWLEGKWVKSTPAFNKELCDLLKVAPLEFNGLEDSIFQAYDREGGDFMEYLHDYGPFAELPLDYFLSEMKAHYPHIFDPEFIEAYKKSRLST